MKRFQCHNEFARTLGVSPPYVTRLRNEGRAVRDEGAGTYDTRHPVNAALLERAAAAEPPEDPEIDPSDPSVRELQRQKLNADIAWKREQRRKLALENSERMKLLVPLDLHRHLAGDINSAVRSNLLTLPERIAPRVVATVRSGGAEPEVRAYLEHELDVALQRFVAAIETSINRGLDDYKKAAMAAAQEDNDNDD